MEHLTLFLCALLCLNAAGSSQSRELNQSLLAVPKELLQTRRVRALIFPNKASILLTAAMTKIVVGGRPSGLQYSIEFDMYVPLPDTIEGWRPTVLLKKPKSKPSLRLDHFNSTYSYNPDQYYYLNRVDTNNQLYSGYVKPQLSSFYRSPQRFTKPWKYAQNYQLASYYSPDKEVYDSWPHATSWEFNHGYRERRQIYDQFEALGEVFQINLRACIKRAMCELRAQLNAQTLKGLLMEDLMRIVLTVPDEVTDQKYRHPVKYRDCARFYAATCPYKVLDFLTQNMSKLKPSSL